MPLRNINSERFGSRYRSAASHFTTTVYVPAGVFWDATASHKSAEGRYKNYEWSHLTVVEKRGAVKRECACRGAIRLPDEQSEEPCEARSQEVAREPQPSELIT